MRHNSHTHQAHRTGDPYRFVRRPCRRASSDTLCKRTVPAVLGSEPCNVDTRANDIKTEWVSHTGRCRCPLGVARVGPHRRPSAVLSPPNPDRKGDQTLENGRQPGSSRTDRRPSGSTGLTSVLGATTLKSDFHRETDERVRGDLNPSPRCPLSYTTYWSLWSPFDTTTDCIHDSRLPGGIGAGTVLRHPRGSRAIEEVPLETSVVSSVHVVGLSEHVGRHLHPIVRHLLQ